jgi:hypothetical protein
MTIDGHEVPKPKNKSRNIYDDWWTVTRNLYEEASTMITLKEYKEKKEEHYKKLKETGLRMNVKCPKCVDGEFFWKGVEKLNGPKPLRQITCNSCSFSTLVLK